MVCKKITEGQRLPFFYGLAWRDILARQSICYPVPFNIIIRYLRSFWYFLSYSRRLSVQERMEDHLQIQFEIRVQEEVDNRIEKASEMAATMLKLEGLTK